VLSGAVADAERFGRLDLVLNNLALIEQDLGHFTRAEALHKRSITLCERLSRPDRLAQAVNNLAFLYVERDQCAKAVRLYRRFGPNGPDALDHSSPEFVNWLNTRGSVQHCLGEYREAESLYRLALDVYANNSRRHDLPVLSARNNLALLYEQTRRYEQALALYTEVLMDLERRASTPGSEHARTLSNMAVVCDALGRRLEAERHIRKALALMEGTVGPAHPAVAALLLQYARLLRSLHRDGEAKSLERRAAAIRATLSAEAPGRYTVDAADLLRRRVHRDR
jgi:tetratricopeptide (TPR) repeat protein